MIASNYFLELLIHGIFLAIIIVLVLLIVDTHKQIRKVLEQIQFFQSGEKPQ